MTPTNGNQQPAQNGKRKGRWSFPEIEKLRRLYGFKSDVQIAKELNRTVQSVRRMVGKVFEGELKIGPWTAKEIRELKNYFGAADVDIIARILRRSEIEVGRKIMELQGHIRERPWTSKDVQQLKRFFGTRDSKDVSVILGRPIHRIEVKAEELCLAKDKGFQRRRGSGAPVRMPRWRPEEIELLCKLYPNEDNLAIATRLKRTVKSVVSKAHDLKLKKSENRLREMGRENVRARYEAEKEMGT
jgi:hypothetical protein